MRIVLFNQNQILAKVAQKRICKLMHSFEDLLWFNSEVLKKNNITLRHLTPDTTKSPEIVTPF